MPVEFEKYRESRDDDDDDDFDWTLREGSNAHTILSFLAEHPEQGFTPKEIHEATDVTRGSVGKTLQRLEERQLVRHAEPYWAIGEDDRVGAYLGMLSSLDTVTEREGTEDYDEWREATNAE
jgi:DNA-binding transcriptional ArsR family regulator